MWGGCESGLGNLARIGLGDNWSDWCNRRLYVGYHSGLRCGNRCVTFLNRTQLMLSMRWGAASKISTLHTLADHRPGIPS
jgi:hypothetical protein